MLIAPLKILNLTPASQFCFKLKPVTYKHASYEHDAERQKKLFFKHLSHVYSGLQDFPLFFTVLRLHLIAMCNHKTNSKYRPKEAALHWLQYVGRLYLHPHSLTLD